MSVCMVSSLNSTLLLVEKENESKNMEYCVDSHGSFHLSLAREKISEVLHQDCQVQETSHYEVLKSKLWSQTDNSSKPES